MPNTKSDLAKWLERLNASSKFATVLGSIPASSDTVDYEGRQTKQCGIKYKKIQKIKAKTAVKRK
jgi:hypothetical protein